MRRVLICLAAVAALGMTLRLRGQTPKATNSGPQTQTSSATGRSAAGALKPEGRNKPFFIYDSGSRALVLFGGYNRDGKLLGDTWRWYANEWHPIESTVNGPTARGGPGMAYDEARSRGLMFGGRGETKLLADTWEWDTNLWKRIEVPGPPARMVPQMAFDSARSRIMLFGGIDVDRKHIFGDTWIWDGRTWSQVNVAGPAPRHHHRMVYDEARRRLVLFGGNGGVSFKPPQLLNDTWEWDGKTWIQLKATGPSARDHHAMAYDKHRSRTVLFGGWDGNTYLADVWEWNGRDWARIRAAGGPVPRGGLPSMEYDAVLKEVILFGGWGEDGPLNDLWSWDGHRWLKRDD